MINKQEILDNSREFGLTPHVIEKDYIIGWVLAGISEHSEINKDWIFKGGTCLKKCFFETYRFSEDLDFTLLNKEHLDEKFLRTCLEEVAAWVYEESGNEIPLERLRIEVYDNPRGTQSAEGRIYYRGPVSSSRSFPRLKLDLMADELIVFDPQILDVNHPYSDSPEGGFQINGYSFEELFAEKIRALSERLRPRDLYDVVNIFRRSDIEFDRAIVREALIKKCAFRDIEVSNFDALQNMGEFDLLESGWDNMLAHQLPELPPFEHFWEDLPKVFEWLMGETEKIEPTPIPIAAAALDSYQPVPSRPQIRKLRAPLEIIKFAAANHLCVDLTYNGTHRLIEPYSLRRSRAGKILLYAVKHRSGEIRSYRLDRVQGAKPSDTPFTPKYRIELDPSKRSFIPETHQRPGLTRH